jgi:FliI/YscN family ATPase
MPVGPHLLGRVIDGMGQPMDGLGPLQAVAQVPLKPSALNPLAREGVTSPIGTGVRAIDALLTCGRGQRIGLFGGSGVGKSTLLGMMARGTAADVVVLALVGERGREVRSFLEHDLGPDGLQRSVVVVSTSDSPPLVRLRAAYGATAVAEYFRDQGLNVLLMMDSVTRFAMAQREVGLAAGEPPTAKGYPPSVFAARAASRPSTPCWSTATTPTNPLPMRCAASSTGTSCSRATSPGAITIRPSTSCRASAARCPM